MPRTIHFRTLAGLALAITVALSVYAPASAQNAGATFTVNSTDGDDDGACSPLRFGNDCTLHEAINAANGTPEADTIAFGIPDDAGIPGNEVKTITLALDLPLITEAVTIDGYTQAGSIKNTNAKGAINASPLIELNGNDSASFGLDVDIPSNVVIQGLVINRFRIAGIRVNLFTGTGHRIEGNFIGTDPSGTVDLGNGRDDVGSAASGVVLQDGNDVIIGGTLPEARNLISGNTGPGVQLPRDSNFGLSNIKVKGNLIGTQKNGTTPLGNSKDGVLIENQNTSNSVIGGSEAGAGNVIAHNGSDGVEIVNFGTGNTVIGNSIFSNDGTGVLIDNLGAGDRISSNSIFSNGGLGIDLDGEGPTTNDPGDMDIGPNDLQNFPTITSAKTSSRATTVRGTLKSTPDQTFTLQFFSNPSGTKDEGKTLLGQKTLADSDGDGTITFTFKPPGKVKPNLFVTATATDEATGDTSEFSTPRKVVAQ